MSTDRIDRGDSARTSEALAGDVDASTFVQVLELERDWARRRVEVYQQVDQAVQQTIQSAVRLASDIRQSMEQEAQAITDRLTRERARLLDEIRQAESQKQSIQDDVAEQRARVEEELAQMRETAERERLTMLREAEVRKGEISTEIRKMEQQLAHMEEGIQSFLQAQLSLLRQGWPGQSEAPPARAPEPAAVASIPWSAVGRDAVAPPAPAGSSSGASPQSSAPRAPEGARPLAAEQPVAMPIAQPETPPPNPVVRPEVAPASAPPVTDQAQRPPAPPPAPPSVPPATREAPVAERQTPPSAAPERDDSAEQADSQVELDRLETSQPVSERPSPAGPSGPTWTSGGERAWPPVADARNDDEEELAGFTFDVSETDDRLAAPAIEDRSDIALPEIESPAEVEDETAESEPPFVFPVEADDNAQETVAAEPTEAIDRYQVTITGTPSFARALEAQRAIQRLPGVKTVQAQQFERGVLVLSVETDGIVSLPAAVVEIPNLGLVLRQADGPQVDFAFA